MSRIRLPEYDPAAKAPQLHVLFNLPSGQVPEFSALLRRSFSGVVFHHSPEQEVLLAVFPGLTDCQGLLIHLSAFLDEFAQSAGVVVELLETRMAAPADCQNPAPFFSRHLRLLERTAAVPAGELCLRLEYGTSFGSGQHPSTRLAMQALDDLCDEKAMFPARVLDVGCGSGILALAAGLLGAREVLGVDIDAEALALARENARTNSLDARLRFAGSPVRQLAGPYDLVVANLTGAVLGGMLDDLARLVRPAGGQLVISGLMGRQLEEICEALAILGFAVDRTYRQQVWRAALLAAGDSRP